jgi:hypothetical protein
MKRGAVLWQEPDIKMGEICIASGKHRKYNGQIWTGNGQQWETGHASLFCFILRKQKKILNMTQKALW